MWGLNLFTCRSCHDVFVFDFLTFISFNPLGAVADKKKYDKEGLTHLVHMCLVTSEKNY